MIFVVAFHDVVAYFLSIAKKTDRPMNSKIQSAHLIYSNSHQHSLKHDLDIMIQCVARRQALLAHVCIEASSVHFHISILCIISCVLIFR